MTCPRCDKPASKGDSLLSRKERVRPGKQQTFPWNQNLLDDAGHALDLALRMYESKESFGEVASSEWFDGDDIP